MKILYVSQSNQISDHLATHTHHNWEIMYILSGKGTMYMDEQTFPFTAKSIFVIPPDCTHLLQSSEPVEDIHIYIQEFRPIGSTKSKVFHDDSQLSVRNLMQTALFYFQFYNNLPNPVDNSIGSLIYELLACFYNHDKNKDPRIEGILELMHKNTSNINFNLTEEIGKSGYSQAHFRKIFKAAFGEPPLTYMNHLRIDYACTLIEEFGNSRSLKDIALTSGFSDQLYFSRVFRKFKNMSPTNFIEKLYSE